MIAEAEFVFYGTDALAIRFCGSILGSLREADLFEFFLAYSRELNTEFRRINTEYLVENYTYAEMLEIGFYMPFLLESMNEFGLLAEFASRNACYIENVAMDVDASFVNIAPSSTFLINVSFPANGRWDSNRTSIEGQLLTYNIHFNNVMLTGVALIRGGNLIRSPVKHLFRLRRKTR